MFSEEHGRLCVFWCNLNKVLLEEYSNETDIITIEHPKTVTSINFPSYYKDEMDSQSPPHEKIGVFLFFDFDDHRNVIKLENIDSMICEYIDCWLNCVSYSLISILIHFLVHASLDGTTASRSIPLINWLLHSLSHISTYSLVRSYILKWDVDIDTWTSSCFHLSEGFFRHGARQMHKIQFEAMMTEGELVALKIIEKSVTHDGLLILSFFVVRRIPWIRGMTQIFMIKSTFICQWLGLNQENTYYVCRSVIHLVFKWHNRFSIFFFPRSS